jgi:hypothetical protein
MRDLVFSSNPLQEFRKRRLTHPQRLRRFNAKRQRLFLIQREVDQRAATITHTFSQN